MATYAVGDIQGCLKPLQALLIQVNFEPQTDKLWVVGDMVNRGPESLKTLRFLYHLKHCLHIVLGNHDLHLLAVAAGFRECSAYDTLKEVLKADDRDILLEWIRQQPLLHHDDKLNFTMVHAGIPPIWTLADAITHAREVEKVLHGKEIKKFLKSMYGNKPDAWSESLKGKERWRMITNYFTRMRFCTSAGQLELDTKSGIGNAPAGFLPWYAHQNRKTHGDKIIFGHWAALGGQANHQNVFAIDTGCVWGGKLTMMRLEDKKLFSVKS